MSEKIYCKQEQKYRYPSKHLADMILTKLSRRKRRDEKSAYFCESCQGWHLTSQDIVQEVA